MIGKEDYVSFETARVLHEKGYSGMITAATLYEAQKWLRGRKIYVSSLPAKDNGITVWYYQVTNDNYPDDIFYTTSQDNYHDYETALDEGIKYALKSFEL